MSHHQPRTLSSGDGEVHVALRDGTHIDRCHLVSAGRRSVATLWVFADGEDLFIPHEEVIDVRPVDAVPRRAA